MKNKNQIFILSGLVTVALLAVGVTTYSLSSGQNAQVNSRPAANAAEAGSVTIAYPNPNIVKNVDKYQSSLWSIEKNVDKAEHFLKSGEQGVSTYSVTATLDPNNKEYGFVVTTPVCAYNTMPVSTIGLSVQNIYTITNPDDSTDVQNGLNWDIGELAAGGSRCTPLMDYFLMENGDFTVIDLATITHVKTTVTLKNGLGGDTETTADVAIPSVIAIDLNSTGITVDDLLYDKNGEYIDKVTLPIFNVDEVNEIYSKTFDSYSRTFTCGDEPPQQLGEYVSSEPNSEYKNVAQSDDFYSHAADSATVTVSCNAQKPVHITGDSTVNAGKTKNYNWTLEKSVDKNEHFLKTDETGESNYTIKVSASPIGSFYRIEVGGRVCVKNNMAVPTSNLQINNKYTITNPDNTSYDVVDAKIYKPLININSGSSKCIFYGKSDLNYGGFVIADGATITTTSTVTLDNDAGDIQSIGPSGAIPQDADAREIDSVNVSDVLYKSGVEDTISGVALQTFTIDKVNNVYERTYVGGTPDGITRYFTCGNGEPQQIGEFVSSDLKTEYVNTVYMTSSNASAAPASATVTVNCNNFTLAVTQDTPATSITRTHNWSIDKSADQSALTLLTDELKNVQYSVNTSDVPTDSHHVNGTITVHNPASVPATLTEVKDVLSLDGTASADDIPATVDCGGIYEVAAGGDLNCTYSAALPDNTARTNIVVVTMQSATYDSSAPVSFVGAQINETDECIDVTDSLQGALGTVCANELPKTFTYERPIGPYSTCGVSEAVDNTASYTANDTGATGSSNKWTVNVTVPCLRSCTYTVGDWKNRAGLGKSKQADLVTELLPRWLGKKGESKTQTVETALKAVQFLGLYGSNNIFQASNGINKLYAELLAAKLNTTGGANGAVVTSTIDAADGYFSTHDSIDWGIGIMSKADKKNLSDWTTALANYNNGVTGPGHCI